MKPKNLKFPFTWEERKPAFYEGVLIVPQFYSAHELWKDEEGLFSKEKNIAVEFCSGNGDWVIEKALQSSSTYWIAVEKRFERVRKIWSKMRNQNISNLLIVCGEALTFTRHYLPDSCINEIFVNFPDPWPKERHAKHRLIQGDFIDEIARTSKLGAETTFVTDDAPYSSQMIEQMLAHHHWKSCFQSPYYINQWGDYGASWFESLWKEKGREFYYMQFERV